MVIFGLSMVELVKTDLNKILKKYPLRVRGVSRLKNEQIGQVFTTFMAPFFNFFEFSQRILREWPTVSSIIQVFLKNFKKHALQAVFKNRPLRKTANFGHLCSGGIWFLNNKTYPIL